MDREVGLDIGNVRVKFRQWISDNAPRGLAELADWCAPLAAYDESPRMRVAKASPEYAAWEQALLDARLICPAWPQDQGGRGLSALEMGVFSEELHRAGLPRITRAQGEDLIGPAIILHGTDAQKRHFLPGIIAGQDWYCQGYSEPNCGSDLAAVETTAIVDGDEIVINGSKTWTSRLPPVRTHIVVLCKSDNSLPRHRNLTWVIVSLAAEGVRTSPIRDITNSMAMYTEFFTDVRVPLFNVVGGVNGGWKVVMSALGNERNRTRSLEYEKEFWDLAADIRRMGRGNDPIIQQRMAAAFTNIQLLRLLGWRAMSNMAEGKGTGPEVSVSKLLVGQHRKTFGEMAIELGGLDGLVLADDQGYDLTRWQHTFLRSRSETIVGGATEIQKTIIGERLLGLPK